MKYSRLPFIFLLLASSCVYKQYNSATRQYETHATLPIVKGIRKVKRHITTYPPAALTAELAAYHKKYNQFPASLNDFYSGTRNGWPTIEKMLQTHYPKISVAHSSPDSLLFDYQYKTMTAEEQAKAGAMVLSRVYHGQFIYTIKNGDILVENKLIKGRRSRTP